MSAFESIFWGVISGIFTSFLLFLFIQIFRNIILPWYRNLIYSGVVVEGEWVYKSVLPFAVDMSLQLKQSANSISGTVTIINIEKTTDIKSFNITGNIKDRFIQIMAKHFEKDKIGSSVFLLEVIGDGTILRGGICFYDILQSYVMSLPVCLTRKGVDESLAQKYMVKQKPNLSKSITVE